MEHLAPQSKRYRILVRLYFRRPDKTSVKTGAHAADIRPQNHLRSEVAFGIEKKIMAHLPSLNLLQIGGHL